MSEEFWVSNVTKHDIVLGDLGVKIPSRKCINLLSKGYYYTKEQLEKSATSGSLYRYRDKIKVNVKLSNKLKNKKDVFVEPSFRANINYSQLKVIEPQYEELQISEKDLINDLTDPEE